MTQTPVTPQTTIDVSGLPEPVVRNIRELVDAFRLKGAGPSPADLPRPPLRGRYESERTGSFTKEQFDEASKELWAGFPRDLPDPSADLP